MKDLKITGITKEEWLSYLEQGIDFHEFYEELNWLTAEYKEGKPGHKYAHYYPINLQRMKRGIKQINPDPLLENLIEKIKGRLTWLVLTEQWCGDGAQTLPLFYKVSKIHEKINLLILARDEYPELMDQFLTNGGRSIPKIIQLDEHLRITGTWGPRPAPAQELVHLYRERGEPYANALHSWYAADRYSTLQNEIIDLLNQHISAESGQSTSNT